jgi:hypothetical protein
MMGEDRVFTPLDAIYLLGAGWVCWPLLQAIEVRDFDRAAIGVFFLVLAVRRIIAATSRARARAERRHD